MEKENQRVFAYTLAKEVSHDELAEVAGGASQMKWTQRPSGRVCGSNGNWDTEIDISIDW